MFRRFSILFGRAVLALSAATGADARIEATRQFYDQLDPAQKRAFHALHMEGSAMGHGAMMRLITFDGPRPLPLLPPMPPMPPRPGS